MGPRNICWVVLAIVVARIVPPHKDVHILIPDTHTGVTSHSRGTSWKGLEMGRLSGLSRWAWCNHKGPYLRDVESEKEM